MGHRFTLIDGLRGLAAAAVLLWHYQHFYMGPHRAAPDLDRINLPLREILEPAYYNGHLGVVLFWTISGFVFTNAYRGKTTSTQEFAIRRFARLYPLHFVTLLVVATLQAIAIWLNGRWLIYGNNDVEHFGRQLLFVAGEGRSASFNAPIWSVSVEIVIYIVFWSVHRRLEMRGLLWPVIFATGFAALYKLAGGNIALCGLYFFLGVTCATFLAQSTAHTRWLAILFLAVVGSALYSQWGDRGPFLNGVAPISMALVLTLACTEGRSPAWLQSACEAIGNCSYGLYLWHIPVQLLLLLIFGAATPVYAAEPWFLAVFSGLALFCAIGGFFWIERPGGALLKKALRKIA